MRHFARMLGVCKSGLVLSNVQWTTPQFEEISLNCEINSYASAQMEGNGEQVGPLTAIRQETLRSTNRCTNFAL